MPLSLPMAKQAAQNPALLQQWQKGLPPVNANRAPAPSPRAATPGAPPVGGSWTLGPSAPGFPPLSSPLLLTDGSVIAHVSCTTTWWRLTPDATGSYVTGGWSQIAPMPAAYTPRFFSSAVLPDGRVITEGGEYLAAGCAANAGNWTNLGAIFDPLANSWTSVAPPAGWTSIGDAQSTVLANGVYMQADCCSTNTALFNPTTLGWTATGAGKFDVNDEEGWTLLPNGQVLTVDAYVGTGTCGMNSERYTPTTGGWASAGNTPSILADCINATHKTFEIGPQVLRPDGTVVAFGGTTCGTVAACPAGTTTVTTTSAIFSTSTSTWSAGPNIPQVGGNNYTLADAPAILLPNGSVLFAASPNYTAFVAPTHFFEMSPTNVIAQVAEPTDAGGFNSFQWNFLMLPNGQVMALETDGSNVWIYTPSGAPNAAWAPTVSSAPANLVSGGVFPLSGTQFNGLSQASNYGDDAQSATNYPIVKIVNNASGHVQFGRSFNHSTMSVAPGAAGGTTFSLPENVEPGPSSLYVVANGIASSPTSVNMQRSLYAKPADFNGDSGSDIIWRSINGDLAIWEMNGGSILASVGAQQVTSDWKIVGTGDFNGDGRSDIVWRNVNGQIAIWEMNGGSVIASVGGQLVGNDWTFVGTGDFNGDGFSDILWRNASGQIVIWEMNGGTVIASVGGQNPGNSWTIAGLGDFNKDGKTDILWRHTSGQMVIWEMNGGTVLASVGAQVVGTDWTVMGVGDFNGDGFADILWRNANGQIVIWEMNGGSVIASVAGQPVGNDWQIVGTGDFNHDGLSDVIWRHTSGVMTIWQMTVGGSFASAGFQSVSPFQWTLVQ